MAFFADNGFDIFHHQNGLHFSAVHVIDILVVFEQPGDFPLGEEFMCVRGLFERIWPFQCGYCASGIQIAAAALLIQNPKPAEEEIRAALSGNLCRCSAYPAILKGVQQLGKYPKRKRYAKRAGN